MRARRPILLAVLALLLAGCGSSDEGKLSSAQGERLTGYVDRAQAAFDDGKCADAREIAGEGARRVARLKGDVDDGLRQNLIDGFNHLESELASNCKKPEKTATPEPTVTATVTAEPTVTASPSPEPTVTATPEPTVTAEPTVTSTPDTGGTSPDEEGASFEEDDR